MESNFGNLCSLKVIQIILNYIKEFVNFKHEVIQMYLLLIYQKSNAGPHKKWSGQHFLKEKPCKNMEKCEDWDD